MAEGDLKMSEGSHLEEVRCPYEAIACERKERLARLYRARRRGV